MEKKRVDEKILKFCGFFFFFSFYPLGSIQCFMSGMQGLFF